MTQPLPQALESLLALATELRAHGFAASPDQTIGFIEAVSLLGPRNIDDIRHAAVALYAIPPERLFEFDAIFKSLFYDMEIAAQAKSSDDDVDAYEPTGGEQEIDTGDQQDDSGTDPIQAERLQSREFTVVPDSQVLIEFERNAKDRIPRRQSYRWSSVSRGRKPDLRRTLREAAKHDGEIIDISHLRRKTRQRRILLLIDVSGSMKELTTSSLRFAHSLTKIADRVETFTLGTRLTRVTSALQVDDRDMAMHRVSQVVADFDGGTRIGSALQAYLSVPRYAGFARGAAVTILSDGLERGDSQAMVEASQRLSRIAWRVSWLTPLAADAEYQPETEALKLSLPYIDHVGTGHNIQSMCSHILNLSRTA